MYVFWYNYGSVLTQEEAKEEIKFEVAQQYMIKEGINEKTNSYVLIDFETPVFANENALIIGGRFDLDPEGKNCRIAFSGKINKIITNEERTKVQLCKRKEKKGMVEKILSENSILVVGLFKKESDISKFVGKKISVLGLAGKIESTFGKSGKIKVQMEISIKEPERIIGADVIMKLFKILKI